jgi:hypothetical protein
MDANRFCDYYELLQLSPNADTETIERIFRHLAKKFHPDNCESPDSGCFSQIVQAYHPGRPGGTRGVRRQVSGLLEPQVGALLGGQLPVRVR